MTGEMDLGDAMNKGSQGRGLQIQRHFSVPGLSPLEEMGYERDTISVRDQRTGEITYQLKDAEVPVTWSALARQILVSKYFRKGGLHGDAGRGEVSVKQVITRVAKAVRGAGEKQGYFATAEDAEAFEDDLTSMLVRQFGAFNSPVWFNAGLFERYGIEGSGGNWAWDDAISAAAQTRNSYERPQLAACFIQSIDDDLMSIFELLKNEARLFKHGSGTGSNFSALRGRQEKLSGGGTSSGLMSFLEVFDRAAGSTKSGGTTRRAAKMVCLDMDHPEIVDFIDWKQKEELKAQALIREGYPSDFNGEAYHTVGGQNSNNSVRVTDDFMRAVETGGKWQTTMRTTGKVVEEFDAKGLWRKVAKAAWSCADPGVQYDTTINDWHTVPNSGRINASNPCCFTGDMLIDTSEGRMSFEALAARQAGGTGLPQAVAFSRLDGVSILRNIKRVWISGHTTELVDVTTETGMSVRCTPEHLFLLSTGDYVAAKDLPARAGLRAIGADGQCYVDPLESITFVRLDREVPVYDAEVHDLHNFCVSSPVPEGRAPFQYGLVAHNSEYMHLDDSACNLSSLNLVKFLSELPGGGFEFDVDAYRQAARIFFMSQEFLVDYGSYPTAAIAKNSHDFRPLGLGYANLGTLLMLCGHAYDSDHGRAIAGALTAILTGTAYRVSAEMAAVKGPFAGFAKNREPMMRVIRKHRAAVEKIDESICPWGLVAAAREDWDTAISEGEKYGYRNSQATVLAPTGTIGLLMDCDTTGIEPDFAQVKFKALAGGGNLKMENASIAPALKAFGYSPEGVKQIMAYLGGTKQFAGAPVLGPEQLSRFGLTDTEIDRLCANISSSFSLEDVFAAHVLGPATVIRLGLTEYLAPSDATSVSTPIRWKPGFSLLSHWGLSPEQIEKASRVILGSFTVEGAPGLKPEHLSVFDCANRCGRYGQRFIAPIAHVKMMAATQPFLSGAISKTVNLPGEATVEEIEEIYTEAWRLGLKAVAVYRDESKASQALQARAATDVMLPLQAIISATEPDAMVTFLNAPAEHMANLNRVARAAINQPVRAVEEHREVYAFWQSKQPKAAVAPGRKRLPKKRRGFTQEAVVGDTRVFLRSGEYADGKLGEIFIDVSKAGGAQGKMFNALAVAISMGMQWGVPVSEYIDTFQHWRFEPSGPVVGHERIRFATSILDFMARVIGLEYEGREDLAHLPAAATGLTEGQAFAEEAVEAGDLRPEAAQKVAAVIDQQVPTQAAPQKPVGDFCPRCGGPLVWAGSCKLCRSCGTPTGGCS